MKNLFLLLLTMVIFFGIAATYPEAGGYKIGDTADDFNLKGVDGKMYSLNTFGDVKGYVVVFTCNSCPYAVMYEDRLIEVANKAKALGFAMIAVNPNDPTMQPKDSYDEMVVRSNEKAFNFPYVFDSEQTVFPKYGATKTPHVFVLNKAKVVKYIGAVDDNARDAASVQMNYVENAMNSILAGKSPDPSSTKAIGCGIKSKA
jgi:peroxiredoxin